MHLDTRGAEPGVRSGRHPNSYRRNDHLLTSLRLRSNFPIKFFEVVFSCAMLIFAGRLVTRPNQNLNEQHIRVQPYLSTGRHAS